MTARYSNRRRELRVTALAGAFLLLTAFCMTRQQEPQPAMAGSLSCGRIYLSQNGANGSFTHTCYGSGQVKYTVNCLIGQKYIFTHKWTGSLSKRFEYHCEFGTSAFSASYQIIG